MYLSPQLTPHLVEFHLIVCTVLSVVLWSVSKKLLYSKQKGKDRCGAGNEVEGHGQCAAMLKVGKPQLCSGKLPLHVCITLLQPRGKAGETFDEQPLGLIKVIQQMWIYELRLFLQNNITSKINILHH